MNYLGTEKAGGGFNPLAAGTKQYGATGRSNPTSGPVDPTGYRERDMQTAARKNAMMQYNQKGMTGNYFSAAFLLRGGNNVGSAQTYSGYGN